jgi:CzcA family heavy metal efflux pump/RND family efflux transporter MFP subunit
VGLVRFALRNPYAIVVATLAIVIFGLATLSRIPVDILPIFKTPAVQILTFYPGMPAEVMEKDVTTRLERWTGQSNGVARQESKSMIGVSIVKDFFRPDIDPNTAMSQVTSLAMSDLFYLPPGTIPPMVMPFDPTASLPLCVLSVSSPTMDETELYDVAYFSLRNRLQGIQGVIAPAVYGGKLRRILTYVDRDKLVARGLSPLDVVNAIQAQNVMIPTGSAKFGALDFQIESNAMVPAVKDLDDVPVKLEGDAPVFVKDIGHTEDSHQIQTNIVRINGRRQVYIPIYRQPGANTIQVVDGVKAAIAPILEKLPKGVNLDVVFDQSVYARNAISSLEHEGLLGALLAALMILFFLGSLRATGVVAFSLPLSILGATVFLYASHQSLNTMTLGGLALVLGLLIDQTIVVLENIERHVREGMPVAEAALTGAGEVAGPVLVITLTVMVVFLPVVFLTGIGRFLFTPLSVSVIAAMGVSFFASLTLIPLLAQKMFRSRTTGGGAEHGRFASFSENGFNGLRQRYLAALQRVLRRPGPTLVAALGLVVLSIMLVRSLGTELFPVSDAGQFLIHVRAATGTRVELTEALVADVEHVVRERIPEHDLRLMISNIGVLNDWPAAYTPNSGAFDAFVSIQLTPHHRKTPQEYVAELRRILPARFPGVEFAFDTGGMVTAALNFGLPSPIDIQVEGNDLEVAHRLAEQVRTLARAVHGAADVRIQQRLDYPQYRVDVDRTKAAYAGLTQDAVVRNVVTALNSSINFKPSFWIDPKNGNHYFIGAQYPEDAIQDLQTLENVPVAAPGKGEPVPLKELAHFQRASAPAEVNHLDISRVTDIFVNVEGRDVGSVARDIQRNIARIETPPGYTIHMRGEVQSLAQSFAGMGWGLLMAIGLVYLVLVLQFKSFRMPLVVLAAVPLGFVGVVALLLLTGTHVSIPAFMGVIMMVGIVVSYSVLLVDFARRREEEGLAAEHAIVEAARLRLRPILMTALATILGLLPMAIGIGSGSEVNAPLGRAVIGGVVASMTLTLFVVPILYVAMRRMRAPLVAPAALALIGALGISGCQNVGGRTAASRVATQVGVISPERTAITRKVALTGSLEPNREATLYAKSPGYIQKILKDIGDRVSKGDMIAEIDDPQGRSELSIAEANYQLAQQTAERLRDARKESPMLVSQQEADQAEASLSATQANRDKAQTRVEESAVRAPFNGVVTERYLDSGALVSGNSTTRDSRIVKVVETSPLRCVVDVPDVDVQSMRAGKRAVVRVAELPDQAFDGTIARMAYALNPGTRTMRVDIAVTNPGGILRPGMYVHVDLDLDTRANRLTVPAGAVTVGKKGAYVLVADRGVARKIPVQTGYDDGVRTEIVSGLNGSETVILVGKDQVAEGDPVTAAPAPPALVPDAVGARKGRP